MTGSHVLSRRILAGASVLPLLIGGLTAATVATAGGADAAVACYQSWSDKDANGWGTGKPAADIHL